MVTKKPSAKKPATKKVAASTQVATKPLSPWQQWTANPEQALNDLCDRIEDGESMSGIAHTLGVRGSALTGWLAQSPERSARAREARAKSAATFDGQALQYLLGATDPFSLTQAREIAQHLRWRASKIAPADYGDRQTIDATLTVTADDLLLRLAAERKQA